MVACWHGLMTVVRSLAQDSLCFLCYSFTSQANLCRCILACTVMPCFLCIVKLNTTRERMTARHNQRTGEIVLIPPSDLSPCFVERQGLASDMIPVLEIIFPLSIISEIQANKGTTTNQVKESVNDLGRLFGRHGNFVSFAHGVIAFACGHPGQGEADQAQTFAW